MHRRMQPASVSPHPALFIAGESLMSSVTGLEKWLGLCSDSLRCCRWLRVAAERLSLLPVKLAHMFNACIHDMIDMPAINARAAISWGSDARLDSSVTRERRAWRHPDRFRAESKCRLFCWGASYRRTCTLLACVPCLVRSAPIT